MFLFLQNIISRVCHSTSSNCRENEEKILYAYYNEQIIKEVFVDRAINILDIDRYKYQINQFFPKCSNEYDKILVIKYVVVKPNNFDSKFFTRYRNNYFENINFLNKNKFISFKFNNKFDFPYTSCIRESKNVYSYKIISESISNSLHAKTSFILPDSILINGSDAYLDKFECFNIDQPSCIKIVKSHLFYDRNKCSMKIDTFLMYKFKMDHDKKKGYMIFEVGIDFINNKLDLSSNVLPKIFRTCFHDSANLYKSITGNNLQNMCSMSILPHNIIMNSNIDNMLHHPMKIILEDLISSSLLKTLSNECLYENNENLRKVISDTQKIYNLAGNTLNYLFNNKPADLKTF